MLTGLVLLILAVPGTGGAQTPDGEIAGRVLDAETRTPLEGAVVRLEPATTSVGRNGNPSSAAPATRTVVTTTEGDYHFNSLPRESYRITVSRLGYVTASVEIDLTNASASGLSFGLDIAPIALLPLEVTGSAPEPFGRMRTIEEVESGSRMLTERFRQQRHLVGDTRELTHAEVLEAITLAETDLFRALQRVPGVSTRDDYTATMWTRGASWDQTRVFFDGMPLFNPTHAGWLFAAINPDAIGAATFHPGYRGANWGEGSAAVLDLRSRRGRSGRPVFTSAEVSLASARLSLDGESAGGGLNWMVAGRRSYVDVITSLAHRLTGNEDLYVPYDFSDLIGRLEGRLGRGWAVEASSIVEYDFLRGDVPGLLSGNRGRWGNRAGRVTLRGPAGPMEIRGTVGGTAFSTLIFELDPPALPRGATLPALENAIRHRSLTLEVEPRGGAGAGKWAAGLHVLRDSVSYDGPFSLLGALISGGSRDPLTQTPFTYGNALEQMALWGERRWVFGSHVQAITGVRVEVGDSVHNGGTRRVAPRVALRAGPGWGTALTFSWSRVFQYMQDVSPAAGPIGPQLHLSAIWLLASPARVFPVVRADLGTVGLERSWDEAWVVNLNAFQRESTGLKIPNPVPGVVTVGRDPDAEAENLARGLEFTARKLAGSWTGSVGYSLGRSTTTLRPRSDAAAGYSFPASADIRHGLDVAAVARVSRSTRFGGAFTYGSGVPFTRLLLGDSLSGGAPPRLEEPNAERTPTYASLDLLLEYSRQVGSWQVTGFGQVRNALGRYNAVTYGGSRSCTPYLVNRADVVPAGCDESVQAVDTFERGLPRLPLIGLRIAF